MHIGAVTVGFGSRSVTETGQLSNAGYGPYVREEIDPETRFGPDNETGCSGRQAKHFDWDWQTDSGSDPWSENPHGHAGKEHAAGPCLPGVAEAVESVALPERLPPAFSGLPKPTQAQ